MDKCTCGKTALAQMTVLENAVLINTRWDERLEALEQTIKDMEADS